MPPTQSSKPVEEKSATAPLKSVSPKTSIPSGGNSFLASILKGELKVEEEQIEKLIPNQNNVTAIWKKYLQEEKDKIDPFFYSYANSAVPEWRAPNILFFKLKSNIAQGAFSNNKSHFVPYLQKRLAVDNVVFESEVEIDPNIVYAPKESFSLLDRLKELKESNPAVDALIERLKLDFFKND